MEIIEELLKYNATDINYRIWGLICVVIKTYDIPNYSGMLASIATQAWADVHKGKDALYDADEATAILKLVHEKLLAYAESIKV